MGDLMKKNPQEVEVALAGSVRVKDYSNRWSVIDTLGEYALLENETWGDETCYLVVRKVDFEYKNYRNAQTGEKVSLPTFDEVICETFDGLEVALADLGIEITEESELQDDGLDEVVANAVACFDASERNHRPTHNLTL